VREYKRGDAAGADTEDLTSAKRSAARRLAAAGFARHVAGEAGATGVFAAFAPPPSARAELGDALGLLEELNRAPKGHARVLWLSDWSAFVLNCCGGDLKARRSGQQSPAHHHRPAPRRRRDARPRLLAHLGRFSRELIVVP
jgi:hypothetical protein